MLEWQKGEPSIADLFLTFDLCHANDAAARWHDDRATDTADVLQKADAVRVHCFPVPKHHYSKHSQTVCSILLPWDNEKTQTSVFEGQEAQEIEGKCKNDENYQPTPLECLSTSKDRETEGAINAASPCSTVLSSTGKELTIAEIRTIVNHTHTHTHTHTLCSFSSFFLFHFSFHFSLFLHFFFLFP